MNHLIHCEKTNTIRQMPHNYCIAAKHPRMPWVLDFNPGADRNLVIKVMDALFIQKNRWNDGKSIVESITKKVSQKVTITWKSTGAVAHEFKDLREAAEWYSTMDCHGVFDVPLAVDIRDITVDCDREELELAALEFACSVLEA